MRIVGVLSWYSESESWLATAVASFARLCDDIVAVDGAYALYPDARPKSHPRQVEAIVHTAEAMGCGCLVYQPRETWRGNEVGKRNKSLELAGTLEPDWVVVFDADYHVLRMNPETIRGELENTNLDVASYLILDGQDFLGSQGLEEHAANQTIDSEWVSASRDIYRWNPTLRVGPAHWHYSVETPRRRWLRGPYELADALDLRDNLVVYHRTNDRVRTRKRAQERYYMHRVNAGIEEVSVG